jgi:hypothetical protein
MTRLRSFVVAAALGVSLLLIPNALATGNGNGNGNGGNSANAPGQTKTPPAAPATHPSKAHAKGKGAAKQTANSSPTTAGMKPANNTAKGTHCTTGGSAGSATCVSTGTNTAEAAAKTDASKRYGNGTTAAQIAVGRGAPAGTDLYGPGNSQPHKVTDCKHKHAVDVHAVKSYSAAACAEETSAAAKSQAVATACPPTVLTTIVTGVWHHTGSTTNPYVLIHPNANSAHMSKHEDDRLATESTTATASAASCNSQAAPAAQQQQQQQQGSVNQNAAVKKSGAVLGAHASKTGSAKLAAQATPKKPSGGVLGATGRAGRALGAVATRGSLPFTGFPIWTAILIAAGLVATGLALRRRGRVTA